MNFMIQRVEEELFVYCYSHTPNATEGGTLNFVLKKKKFATNLYALKLEWNVFIFMINSTIQFL